MSRVKFKALNELATANANSEKLETSAIYETAEKIAIHNQYTKEDLADVNHLKFVSGIAPNLGGPYSTMYTIRPWTVRQYAGFSTAEKSPVKCFSNLTPYLYEKN